MHELPFKIKKDAEQKFL